MTETWLNATIPDSAVTMTDFTLIRQDRHKVELSKSGGICIYFKDKYIVDHLSDSSEVTTDYEVLCVKVKFDNIRPSHLLGVYRPPKGKQIVMFDKLSEIIDNIDLIRTELFVLGDFNIDYNSKALLRKFKVKNFESKYNISQLISTCTRITESTATILDWAYVSTEHISAYGTLNHNISDHLPVFVVRKKERNKCRKKEVEGRSYLRYSTERFQDLLNGLDWDIYDQSEDNPEVLWDIFEHNIVLILDKICPIRKLAVPEYKPEWLNNEILLLMRR